MNRSEAINRLTSEEFDICIIGSGASGAGSALDAALRGYKVALIDKKDFASETSSRSTKLIHGGVRYLEQAFMKLDFAQLKQVRHGLEERRIVLQNAPHLARPLALLTPVFSWVEGLYYSIGLRIYDWFAKDSTLPKGKWLNNKEVLARMPTLDEKTLHSAVLYYDGQLDDSRYCLALAQSSSEKGAAVANYIEVNGFTHDAQGKLSEARVTDTLGQNSFAIKAKIFINCTGAYADHVRLMANPKLTKRLRPSKGVHIVLPYKTLNSQDAMLIPKTSDGRVVFAIPFEGELMVGTTDTEYNELDQEPVLEKEEVGFLLDTLATYLQIKPKVSEVKAGFGGLRPLLAADPNKSTKGLTRDHEVEHDQSSNLVSLLGGKWTTYRLMAQDTIDEVEKLLGQSHPCTTGNHLLAGAEGYDPDSWKKLQKDHNLDEEVARHLLSKYGSRVPYISTLLQAAPALSARLVPHYPYIEAEVVYQVQHEMAVTPRDVLARRLRMEITDWKATLRCLPTVVSLMAKELSWSAETANTMAMQYETEVKQFQKKAGF